MTSASSIIGLSQFKRRAAPEVLEATLEEVEALRARRNAMGALCSSTLNDLTLLRAGVLRVPVAQNPWNHGGMAWRWVSFEDWVKERTI